VQSMDGLFCPFLGQLSHWNFQAELEALTLCTIL